MVGSLCPPNSEVHGLALHGQTVRSFLFMRVLFIGDIVGSPGREIVRDRLADLVSQKRVDLVIANGENSASGFGITPKIVEELLKYGVEVISGGNHSWVRREIMEFITVEPECL